MLRNDLNDLVAFRAVAKARSFSRAAAELGMSPSALSHALRGLETRLGVRLLARTTRSVAPTEAGHRLLHSLDPALDEIATSLAALANGRERPSGTVRITTFEYAARTVLDATLPGFLLAHPEVKVEVDIDAGLTDIVAGGFDAGIRFGDGVEKDMIAVRVGPDHRTVVVGTPGYLEQHRAPETPDDLADHTCLAFKLATAGGLLAWEFERGGRTVKIRPAGSLVANDGAILDAAVRAGVGLGYTLEAMVSDDLIAGRLVEVLPDWSTTFAGCHLYHPSRRQTPPALQALIAALKRSS